MAKKTSKWILKKREFECVGIQYRVTMSTRRFMKVRVESKPMLVEFVREPDNAHDPNAISVHTTNDPNNPYKGMKLGYLRKEVSAVFAPLVDDGDIEFGLSFMTELDAEHGVGILQVKIRVRRGLKLALDRLSKRV